MTVKKVSKQKEGETARQIRAEISHIFSLTDREFRAMLAITFYRRYMAMLRAEAHQVAEQVSQRKLRKTKT